MFDRCCYYSTCQTFLTASVHHLLERKQGQMTPILSQLFWESFSSRSSVGTRARQPRNLRMSFLLTRSLPAVSKYLIEGTPLCQKSRHQKCAKKIPNINTLFLLITQSSNFPRRWPTLTRVRQTYDFLWGVLYFSVSYSKGRYMLQKGKTDLGL